MTTYHESLADLLNYLTARVPLIGLQTLEPNRAVRMIREVATNPKWADQSFAVYTRARGLRDLRTGNPLSQDRSFTGAMDFAAEQFATGRKATVVFVEPDDAAADTSASRHLAELARLADENLGSVVLVTDRPLWSGLQRMGMSISLDLPNGEEMYGIIASFLQDNDRLAIEWGEPEARRAAEFLVGVTEATAVNVMATVAAKGSLRHADIEQLATYKDRHFADLAGLERVVVRPEDVSVGGLRSLRDWLRRRHQLIVSDLRGSDLRPPRGVLLVGVPGCGKSLSAKAIAGAWQLPLYRLDFATILGMWVGQSESRLREALETADRVAPCVLWIDEIEKGLAGQNDSTGVSRRLVGQFLFWLQESRSRVFVVATSNDVKSLPPELLRKGRFDELFFVDLPDPDDRREIIELYYRRYVKAESPEGLIDELVVLSEGFAGSDIEAALHEVGAEILISGGAHAVQPSFVLEVFRDAVPLSRTNPEVVEDIRAWGRARAVPAGRAPAPTGSRHIAGRRVIQKDAGEASLAVG